MDPIPSFKDETKCEEFCARKTSLLWENELFNFDPDPALPLIPKPSFCMKMFECDDGLKLLDGMLIGFELGSKPMNEKLISSLTS